MENIDSAGTSLFLARRSFNVKTKQNKKQRQEEEEEKTSPNFLVLGYYFVVKFRLRPRTGQKKKKTSPTYFLSALPQKGN